jgi:hypothetical protein
VHQVFLVKIDKKDKYQLFKETVESMERDETPGKPNRWTDYINLLDGTNEDFSNTTYCGRRSRVYDLPTKELQRYFEECTDDMEELGEALKAWHARKFPLLEIESATFYVYGWSMSKNGYRKIRPIGSEVYYAADGSSTMSSLKITMDDLFGDDNVVPVSDTTAVPLPAGDLRAEIDNGIEQHIANTIEKLTDDLQREYLHWKQPPFTTTDVAEPAQIVRNPAGHNLRPLTLTYNASSSTKDGDSSKVGNDKPQVDTTEDIGHAQEVQAMDTTLSPEFNRTLRSADEGAIAGATEIDSSLLVESSHDDKLHIPRQRQPTFAPERPLDESTPQSAHTEPAVPVYQTVSKENKRSRTSDGTEPPLKKAKDWFMRRVSGGSSKRGAGPGASADN